MSYKRLYPPVYEIAALLYYTIGQDPCVHILNPKCIEPTIYGIGIEVDSRQQADYIRVIIPCEYRTGNTLVRTFVYAAGQEIDFPCIATKNQRDVANVFCSALRTNPLFIGVITVPQGYIPVKSYIEVCVVKGCVPKCGYTLSIADAFAQVTKLHYGVIISTEVLYRECCREELSCACLYCKGCGPLAVLPY